MSQETTQNSKPDYWLKYEIEGETEVLEMSNDLLRKAGKEVFAAMKKVKEKIDE